MTTAIYDNLKKRKKQLYDRNNMVNPVKERKKKKKGKKLAEMAIAVSRLFESKTTGAPSRNYHSHGLWLSFNPFQYVGISAS